MIYLNVQTGSAKHIWKLKGLILGGQQVCQKLGDKRSHSHLLPLRCPYNKYNYVYLVENYITFADRLRKLQTYFQTTSDQPLTRVKNTKIDVCNTLQYFVQELTRSQSYFSVIPINPASKITKQALVILIIIIQKNDRLRTELEFKEN